MNYSRIHLYQTPKATYYKSSRDLVYNSQKTSRGLSNCATCGMSPSGQEIPISMKDLVAAGIARAAAQGRSDDKKLSL
jgi:hypothetical protein